MANTSSRTLRLLSLLQTHRFWAGTELADRLEVSERTLRRDIERLRDLGYPVHSNRGVEGGYQLAPGGSMPPLVVDEDEAIAMVVALRLRRRACTPARCPRRRSRRWPRWCRCCRVGSGVGPSRCERRPSDSPVLARPPRSRRGAARHGRAGDPGPRAGPLRLHREGRQRSRRGAARATSSRTSWSRSAAAGTCSATTSTAQDWRSFRLDRLQRARRDKAIFRPRDLPIPGGDAAEYVRNGVSRRDRELRFTVAVTATEEHVRGRIGPWARVVEVDGDTVVVAFDANDVRWAVFGIGYLDAPTRLLDAPEELRAALSDWATRLAASARATASSPPRTVGTSRCSPAVTLTASRSCSTSVRRRPPSSTRRCRGPPSARASAW